jgi:hypothetical protein
MLAAARSRLDTAPGSQSSSAARSTVLSGPADRRSGMPSRATLELIPLIPRLDELKVAVESAGLACHELVRDTPPSKFSDSSASCGEFTSLAIYSDDLHMKSQLDFWRPAGQRAINIGKNWSVVSEDPKLIQKSLGGTILHTGP